MAYVWNTDTGESSGVQRAAALFSLDVSDCFPPVHSSPGDQVAVYSELCYPTALHGVSFHPHEHMVAFCAFGPSQPVHVYQYDRRGDGDVRLRETPLSAITTGVLRLSSALNRSVSAGDAQHQTAGRQVEHAPPRHALHFCAGSVCPDDETRSQDAERQGAAGFRAGESTFSRYPSTGVNRLTVPCVPCRRTPIGGLQRLDTSLIQVLQLFVSFSPPLVVICCAAAPPVCTHSHSAFLLFADKSELTHTGRSLTSESSAVSLNIRHAFIFTSSLRSVSATRVCFMT